MADPENLPYCRKDASTTKPPYSYLGMVAFAIASSPEKRLPVRGIHQALGFMFDFFRTRNTGWINQIADTLAYNDCFLIHKVSREVFWTVDLSKVAPDSFRRQEVHSISQDDWALELNVELGVPPLLIPDSDDPVANSKECTFNEPVKCNGEKRQTIHETVGSDSVDECKLSGSFHRSKRIGVARPMKIGAAKRPRSLSDSSSSSISKDVIGFLPATQFSGSKTSRGSEESTTVSNCFITAKKMRICHENLPEIGNTLYHAPYMWNVAEDGASSSQMSQTGPFCSANTSSGSLLDSGNEYPERFYLSETHNLLNNSSQRQADCGYLVSEGARRCNMDLGGRTSLPHNSINGYIGTPCIRKPIVLKGCKTVTSTLPMFNSSGGCSSWDGTGSMKPFALTNFTKSVEPVNNANLNLSNNTFLEAPDSAKSAAAPCTILRHHVDAEDRHTGGFLKTMSRSSDLSTLTDIRRPQSHLTIFHGDNYTEDYQQTSTENLLLRTNVTMNPKMHRTFGKGDLNGESNEDQSNMSLHKACALERPKRSDLRSSGLGSFSTSSNSWFQKSGSEIPICQLTNVHSCISSLSSDMVSVHGRHATGTASKTLNNRHEGGYEIGRNPLSAFQPYNTHLQEKNDVVYGTQISVGAFQSQFGNTQDFSDPADRGLPVRRMSIPPATPVGDRALCKDLNEDVEYSDDLLEALADFYLMR